MDMVENLNEVITWRGSKYRLQNVEGDRVHWYNPVSRHSGHCPVEAWRQGDPYDGRYS